MLNSETKQKINSLRQILVGRVPNPQSQVDQITNALIYKYMDDMDQQAISLGGKASFFAGDYEKYSWKNLMDTKIGAQERMNIYIEALKKIPLNKNLPVVFRDILKSAYWADHTAIEVLNLFLHEIDGFIYSNSEELGNAFEYLLAIMGSQGDAGMFRTPRHIIDFIVAVVNPKKDDLILDPSCGTAGFLISAYKHICKDHDGIDNKTGEKTNKEITLTPNEVKGIHKNFTGYDISPEMVKLSRVNMFLHQFPEPKIFGYDTISSIDRWEDNFDVILANPPFMTPKGGMIPHNKFSIKAKKSEVLFVDYIIEHLRPKGRAGIIVPEGIIFKSENAYKQLRKALVEDGLWAVVSLPQGVFNPYAGVKTSILLFDNDRSKVQKEICFVKIENDGFDLGAQRREIEKNDLPTAVEILEAWKIGKKKKNEIALWVKKEKIAESGDYNLTSERYREVKVYKNVKWEMVELGEVCEVLNGYAFKSKNYADNGIRIIRITNVQKGKIVDSNPKFYPMNTKELILKYKLKENDLLLSLTGNVGRVGILQKKFLPASLNQRVACLRLDENKILTKYLFYIFNQNIFENDCVKSASGIAQKNLSTVWLEKYKIPLPPLKIQKEIVEQIEVKQNAINHAKEIIKNLEKERRYFGQELRKLENVKMVELGEVAEVISGQSPESKYYNKNGDGIPFYQGKIEFTDRIIGESKYWTTKITKVAEKNDILMSVRAPVGPVNFTTQRICIGRGLAAIRANKKINPIYLFVYLQSIQDEIKGNGGAVFDSINRSQIENIKIPLPSSTDSQTSMDIQSEIVEEIEWEKEIIENNKKLIKIMEQKIEKVISKI